MNIKPILFNTEMVREILRGRKTVTRRVVKERGWKITGRPTWADESTWKKDGFFFNVCSDGKKENAKTATCHLLRSPYNIDDILWVRETWAKDPFGDGYIYPTEVLGAGQKWRPSIYMPKEAARIFLRVTDIRAEKLQDIALDSPGPENQVIREGFMYLCDFIATWNNIIKPEAFSDYCWDANPWCWIIEFKRITKREAGM